MKYSKLARLEINIDGAKQILDEALQKTQEFPYKDWDAEKVKELIIKIKTALNREGGD